MKKSPNICRSTRVYMINPIKMETNRRKLRNGRSELHNVIYWRFQTCLTLLNQISWSHRMTQNPHGLLTSEFGFLLF